MSERYKVNIETNTQTQECQPYPFYIFDFHNQEFISNLKREDYPEIPDCLWATIDYLRNQRRNSCVIVDRRLTCFPSLHGYTAGTYAPANWLNISFNQDTREFSNQDLPRNHETTAIVAALNQLPKEIFTSYPFTFSQLWIGLPEPNYCEAYPFAKSQEDFRNNMGLNKPDMNFLRTLSAIKRQNPATYYDNEDGEYHRHLAAWVSTLTQGKKKRPLKRVLECISKRVGYPVVQLASLASPRIVPMDRASGYRFKDGSLQWLLTPAFEDAKARGDIKWCTHNKDWFSRACFRTVYFSTLATKDIAINGGYTPIKTEECEGCKSLWIAGQVKKKVELDTKLCPTCHKQPLKINPETTYGNPISGYHAHKESWTYYVHRIPGFADANTLPMGLEVEVRALKSVLNHTEVERAERAAIRAEHADAPTAAMEIYKHMQGIDPNYNLLYFEYDGSLDNGGFEIITNPMTLAFHQNFWPQMLPFMLKHVRGWQVTKSASRTDYYGIHITSHRRYWSDRAILRLAQFCGYIPNKNFVYAISQRRVIYGASGTELATTHTPKVSDFVTLTRKKITQSPRYNVHVKKDLVEIRMFRSTLKPESFMKNLEFVDSFRNWANETSWSIRMEDYLQWLTSKKENEKRYGNLLSYLSQSKFSIKGNGTVANVFKDYFKKDYTKGQSSLFPITDEEAGTHFTPDMEK